LPHGFGLEGFDDEAMKFVAVENLLDTNPRGSCWMNQPAVSDAIIDRLTEGVRRGHYELGHWVLMPNHVYLILRPTRDLSATVRQIKSATAREANLVLGRKGQPFWARDYFDRWIRDRNEEQKIARYIERNPAKAGLLNWQWQGVGTRTSATGVAGPSPAGTAARAADVQERDRFPL